MSGQYKGRGSVEPVVVLYQAFKQDCSMHTHTSVGACPIMQGLYCVHVDMTATRARAGGMGRIDV